MLRSLLALGVSLAALSTAAYAQEAPKRIYLVDFDQADADGVLTKIGYIDLLDIKDPEAIAKRGSKDGVFSFPFLTIENVDRVTDTTIIVGNDNNYPGSTGRQAGRADDDEFMILEVKDLLATK